jgi:hypothetical protein
MILEDEMTIDQNEMRDPKDQNCQIQRNNIDPGRIP